MGALTMPFLVKHGEPFDDLVPGAQVEFQLAFRGDTAEASRVRVKPSSDEGVVQDRGVAVKLPIFGERLSNGDVVPDFELVDPSGHPVRLSDFYGRLVLVNFIYTRCPLPEVCPRLASSFALMQRRFREQLERELILLSITLDPKYDTPEVLEKYGRAWKANPSGWYFLTGSERDIGRVADRFGLAYWSEEGFLVHTSLTCLIGKDGRLIGRVSGPSYDVGQLGDLVAQQLEVTR
jgi:protein SCO1/2